MVQSLLVQTLHALEIRLLIFMATCGGGSCNPGMAQIYHWTGHTFRKALDIGSPEQALWIEDLRHNGRYQVRCVELVGKDLCHSCQVRWADIYEWNGSDFVEADAKYPHAFRKYRAAILERLKEHPDDPELLKYLGKSYLYEGRKRRAYAAFAKMERACEELTRTEEDSAPISWWNLGEIAEWEGRHRRAVYCFRQMVRVCRASAQKEKDAEMRDYYLRYAKNGAEKVRQLGRRL